ncbi:A disintegrin and metalloproteinase with thrombospondin motifs 9-like [Mya arenaria]|uniref:A disintegrin and metalloproteinase with thrombospondin motifs 9-like n=1 Tax=Mya arenaria TaxID=6604 RepID=UPI0022DF14DA|nr:A disintegrin and metalloproteinase with thrombospondin motifs 9-like [Mya arenaria]
MRHVWVLGFCVLLYGAPRIPAQDPLPMHFLGKERGIQFSEPITVFPERIYEYEDEHQGRSHFHKRSVKDSWHQSVDYTLKINDRDVKICLTNNEYVVTPEIVVQHFNGSLTWLEEQGSIGGLSCFYEGQVNGDTGSRVAVNLCDGMTGSFSIDGEHYFIEPYTAGTNSSDLNHQSANSIPHFLYSWTHFQMHNHSEPLHSAETENYKHRRRKRSIPEHSIDDLANSDISDINRLTSFNNLYSFSTSPHRQKRSVSYKNYVEVLVVADHLMFRYHQDDLQNYILNLMAIVNTIYRGHTIQQFIQIIVVKIVVFHSEWDGPKITQNASETLKRFCKWQSQNNQAEGSKYHYDTAILLTRQNICRAPDKCDTLGLAELGTMCDADRSCAIIEDIGIASAYIIAHELGHVFNLPHDDDEGCRRPIYNRDPHAKTHIMAPTIDKHTDPWSWSECSAALLAKYLDSGHGNCLHNKPKMKKYRRKIKEFQTRKSGSIYNVDKQCTLMYGKGAKHCHFHLSNCSQLWCLLEDKCRTLSMPMADGTACGYTKLGDRKVPQWCQSGQCVIQSRTKVVKGGWSGWSDYGRCSRSCGGGIKSASRECTSPVPSGGGKFCTGKRVKYRHCNTKPCPSNSNDFRLEQCAEYNSQIRHYNIPYGSRWIPKYDGIQEKDWCKLYCKADSSPSYFYVLNYKVVDGTKCRPDGDDICVNGHCRRAGCDNKLGSKMKRDRCGVCGGDSGSCKTISGNYNTVSGDYNNVTMIPAGATNIDIRQHGYRHLKEDENYLVLVNVRNEYLLNGNYQIAPYPQKVKVKGAELFYSGSDTVEERINSTGTLGENILLQVLSVGDLNPPEIQFSYTMSLHSNEVRFEWKEDQEWTDCDDICNGWRMRKVKCVRDDDQSLVSAQRCENQPKPYTESERCNQLCTLSWRILRDECSTNCGPGEAKQYVSCLLTTRVKTSTVDMKHCEKHISEIGPKPQDLVVCQGKCLETQWKYTDWTECTSSCGGGAQKRAAECVDTGGSKVADSYCNQKDLLKERQCNTQPCPVWRVHDWTGCSVTCGHGSRHRKVTCHVDEQEVIETQCDYKQKPHNKLECYMGTCPRWLAEDWGECSTSCEMGIAIRGVKCLTTSGKILDDYNCDATQRPYETKHCSMGPCPTSTVITTTPRIITTTPPLTFSWTKGSWTQCSASCGEGIKQRYVTCMNSRGEVADAIECDQQTKPQETETCLLQACGYWRNGDWGKCSVTCGAGTQTRVVVCTLLNRKTVDENHCDVAMKLENERRCEMKECKSEDFDIGVIITNTVVGISHWRIGPWSACSTTCGEGWQRRQVICHDEKGLADSCAESQKPEARQTCDAGACPAWVKGDWSQCSKSCGEMGMQKRTVVCQSAEGRQLPDRACNFFKRPPDTGICNNGPCSKDRHWQVGPWATCSVTCGTGASQRDVICVSVSGVPLPSGECKELKPRNTKRCTQHPCPSWAHTRWGKCSTSCGAGVQQRQVVCRMGSSDIKPDSLCLQDKKPRSEKKCNQRPCSNYMWKTKKWSNCSRECGFGMKTREVYCSDLEDKSVNVSRCVPEKRPKDRRRCSEFPCPFMWNTSPWTECSASCGPGMQSRRAACHSVTKEGWILPGEIPYGCKAVDKPPESQTCDHGPCTARYRWLTAPWGECSARCGHGYERRQVQCVDPTGKRKKKKFCSKQHRPYGRRPCYKGPCYANSCKQLRDQTSIRQDGSYKLYVQERLLEVFCKNMRHELPEEYLTLPAGETENFSEVYPFRLKRRRTCPNNGTRLEPCTECRERPYRNAGKTSYSRVKIDLQALKIQVTDVTFSSSINGKNIPFGSAGDCYSSAGCPQGRFQINLSGTGFAVATETAWRSNGNNATQHIQRLQEGEIVQGWCGGLCGWCSPLKGIQLTVLS